MTAYLILNLVSYNYCVDQLQLERRKVTKSEVMELEDIISKKEGIIITILLIILYTALSIPRARVTWVGYGSRSVCVCVLALERSLLQR